MDVIEPQGGATQTRAAIPFPSVAWFEALAALMRADRSQHEKLGYVDCVAGFCVTDGGAHGRPTAFHVTFDAFDASSVREADPAESEAADFTLEASLATWREMIENIARGGGRADLTHSLNHLSHMGQPISVRSSDPLRRDLYFRYNQSLQAFMEASASFATSFPPPASGG
jgi:hypothetical protein